MSEQAIAMRDAPLAPQVASVATPMELLSRAVENGASIEMLERLMGLQERWEKNQARKAFDAAMAAAKAEIPVIAKNRTVDFTSQKGRTHYRHEDMAEIVRTVDPVLAKHGLFCRFRTRAEPNEPVTVTCIISHRDGHFEENSLTAGRDESGNKNPHQAIASAVTLLQRYTLKAALGLAASDDDDGRAASTGGAISEEQLEQLRTLIVDAGADLPRFCAHMKVARIEDISVAQFPRAIAALNQKKKAAQ